MLRFGSLLWKIFQEGSMLLAFQQAKRSLSYPNTIPYLLQDTESFDHNAAAILPIGSVTIGIFEHTFSDLISHIVK